MSYKPFKFARSQVSAARVRCDTATLATVRPVLGRSVATVATVARVDKPNKSPPTAESVATVAVSQPTQTEKTRPEPDAADLADAIEERAAIIEHDAGLPRAWAESFARILCSPPPGDFADHPDRRQSILDGALRFADAWGAEAHWQGWTVEEVFGLHPTHPAARYDRRGLAWLLADGARVVAIDENGADIVNARGVASRYYRRGRLQ